MLLVPDRHQRRFDPAAHGAQPVNPSVAGRTKGDEQARLMHTGTAVMNGELSLRPTGAAATTVAFENCVAMAGEAKARVRLAGVAAAAQSGSPELGITTTTEKPGLPARSKGRAGGRRGRARRKDGWSRKICYAVQSTG